MKSFIEELIEAGYTYNEANSICVCIENELPIEDNVEEMYWDWFNRWIMRNHRKEDK